MSKDSGKKIIRERVEEFEKNKAILTQKGHGETNIRSNYIDVMFEALGWNMKSHYEVTREFSQKDKSANSGTKKVDYAFKINGKLKFFIEAKEASVDLEKDKAAIYQAKRYAYSSNGKAPVVILTDFEEFRVFNVIKAPYMDNTDRELLKSHTMRYTDYLTNWDLLYDTFSKEAVANGSLDKLRGKIDKNTKTMDVDFLEQITGWREELAKNIAIRNENLNVDEINEAVQRILDRLVFIRNLEDREIEPEDTLLNKTKLSENIYKSIVPIFNELNVTYNGLLFKKHFSEEINVDDKTIKDIIRQMCYPVSPFQFDVIEPEILGRIYEKFLGSKIRLTESHRAKVEEKIEVRKAGGVYYTPEYIVEYIVQNTVGKKIEGLTPQEITQIKIVDPACGSGSFLLGAYSYLLEYHQKWYAKNQKEKNYQTDWYKTKEGEIKVTLNKRGDILKNNIFGVDIDKEATEVSIMSLYLKMLDDGFDKDEKDLFFIKGSILPDMSDNVKFGNSLVGTDYFDGKLNFTTEEFKQINPFEWENEFKNIFSNGGFDCVIGNPPYVSYYSKKAIELTNELREYYQKKYKFIPNKQFKSINTVMLFLYIATNLFKKEGLLGFIIDIGFCETVYQPLRSYLSKYKFIKLVHGISAFEGVKSGQIILMLENSDGSDNIPTLRYLDDKITYTPISKFMESSFHINYESNLQPILNKIDTKYYLSSLCDISCGLEYGALRDLFVSDKKHSENWHPVINGAKNQPEKYSVIWDGNYVLFDKKYEEELIRHKKNYSKTGKYVHLISGDESKYKEDKIFVRQSAFEIIAGYDESGLYALRSVFVVISKESKVNLKLILAILNSKLISFYAQKTGIIIYQEGKQPQIRTSGLNKIPLPVFLQNHSQSELKEKIISIVDKIFEVDKEINSVKSDSRKLELGKQKSYYKNTIDKEVYQLYNLTPEEIKIIEAG